MGTFGRLGSLLGRGHLGTEADRTTFRTLHTASLAGPALRLGLTESSAERAVKHIHALLGAPAVALTDTAGVLAWDGRGVHHTDQCSAIAKRVVEDGGTVVVQPADLVCPSPSCEVRRGVVAPLVVEERVVGTLQVFGASTSAGLLRATEEVAQWVSGQLALAELDASRTRLMEAEVRALRAQISPHFIYNSLSAIASFVRTDPDRARELLLEFADFTRYSFRQHGAFTTLAEELRSIERYLMLERARFGDRLSLRLQVAPEVLPVTIPFLCLQPLVENAVRHGLEGKAGGGTITIMARDLDRECEITIEDDGAGEDPERVRRALAGHPDIDSVGLGNVDARLRSAFGDDHGLVVETAPDAGTKVTVRVPKYAPGVHT
ncbi:MAG TPA: histidine kinase [Marmoricola sp.]